jgi:hypothetical protein
LVGWRRASLGKSVRMGKQVRCVAGMGTVVVGVPPEAIGQVRQADHDPPRNVGVGHAEEAIEAEMPPPA